MISNLNLRTSVSGLALCRALPQTQQPPVSVECSRSLDQFTPCHHHHHEPQPAPAFNLLDHLSRIPTQCYYCNGSGKCQQDYPRAGTGKDWKGEDEYRCSGSGKCDHCGGTGWIYQRHTITLH